VLLRVTNVYTFTSLFWHISAFSAANANGGVCFVLNLPVIYMKKASMKSASAIFTME
jgi:hypothetical protein